MKDAERIKEMVKMMEEAESKEKPGDDAKESSELQAKEDKYGIEKHDSGSEEHALEHSVCPHCGKEIESKGDASDMESPSEDVGEKPGLFSKAPKIAIMIASRKK